MHKRNDLVHQKALSQLFGLLQIKKNKFSLNILLYVELPDPESFPRIIAISSLNMIVVSHLF